MQKRSAWAAALTVALAWLPGPAWGAAEGEPPEPRGGGGRDAEIQELREAIAELARQNRELERSLEALEREIRQARSSEPDPAPAPVSAGPGGGTAPIEQDGAIASARLGAARLQLLDVALDVLGAVGGSSVGGESLQLLQAGGHDPRQRGFTLQQVELSLIGAVDPYLGGEAHLIYFLDPEGESRFEIEEAFATTRALPFGAERLGLQVEAGQFFTEFGRINPQHPHQWDWQDQPVVNSRFFGADGMRGPGVRLGWLLPLPWFSELHLGMQNCGGETMVSFCANDEVFEERAIGGRPFGEPRVTGLEDFTWLARLANGFDLSDTWSTQLGVSSAFGQNASGGSGFTSIAGGDWVLKWRPLTANRGWPFLIFQAEAMGRWYDSAGFAGCPLEECQNDVSVPGGTLEDWGLYAQLLWGFELNWAAGIRAEYATGSGSNLAFEDDGVTTVVVPVRRNDDPFRGDRHRISPLLVFQPTEFSRLRLQYNYDHARFLDGNEAHSLWAGLEFLFGAHPAHSY